MDSREGRAYYVTGRANMEYQVTRNWSARVDYRRQPQFLGGFGEPLVGNSVGAGVVGLLTERLGLQTSAGFYRGEAGAADDDGSFEGYTGSVSLYYALTRRLAVYGTGFYYRTALQDASLESVLRLGELERRGVGLGLTWRIPLIARGHRS